MTHFKLTGIEAGQVDEMLNLHEQQVQIVDRAKLSAAIVESYRRASAAMS